MLNLWKITDIILIENLSSRQIASFKKLWHDHTHKTFVAEQTINIEQSGDI